MTTNQFKELKTYLQSRIVSLTDAHASYKKREEEEKAESTKMKYNSCAVSLWDTKDEVEKMLSVLISMEPKEQPYTVKEVHVWSISNPTLKIVVGNNVEFEITPPPEDIKDMSAMDKIDLMLGLANNITANSYFSKPKPSTIEPEDTTSPYGAETGRE